MAICAYCNKDKKLTKEHVIPNFMYKFQKENQGKHTGWNEKAGKMIPAELIVRDVCGDCNNVELGSLDNYAKSFVKTNGLMTENFLKPSIELAYDYNCLLRWLLKVSFNSARSASSHPELFSKYVPYILNNDSSTCAQDRFLMVGLVKPKVFSEVETQRLSNSYTLSDKRELNPFHVRISTIEQNDDRFVMRVVVIGALMFFFPLFTQDLKIGFKKSIVKSFLKLKKNKNVALLDEKRCIQPLNQMNVDFVDAYAAQLSRVRSTQSI